LSDPSRLDQFRQASIRRASNYSLERILPLYEALYRQVLEEDNR
jgi:hypothetical protein